MNKKLIIKSVIITTILVAFFAIIINICIINNAKNKIYTPDKAPEKQV